MYYEVDSRAILTGFVAFQKQDSEKYFIDTKARCKFAIVDINKRLLCKSKTYSDTVKMEEEAILSDKFNGNNLDSLIAAKGGTRYFAR